jgi:membrane protein implicated in regulation of membrane protease activity
MNLTQTLPHTLELFKEQKKARVEHTITPQRKGRVFYEGTYWPARLYSVADGAIADYALDVSSWVTVIGRQGLTLLVVPLLPASVCA